MKWYNVINMYFFNCYNFVAVPRRGRDYGRGRGRGWIWNREAGYGGGVIFSKYFRE